MGRRAGLARHRRSRSSPPTRTWPPVGRSTRAAPPLPPPAARPNHCMGRSHRAPAVCVWVRTVVGRQLRDTAFSLASVCRCGRSRGAAARSAWCATRSASSPTPADAGTRQPCSPALARAPTTQRSAAPSALRPPVPSPRCGPGRPRRDGQQVADRPPTLTGERQGAGLQQEVGASPYATSWITGPSLSRTRYEWAGTETGGDPRH